MSLCPVCGRVYCDHTASERGQTEKEMLRNLSAEEMRALWSGNPEQKLKIAKKHAHDPVPLICADTIQKVKENTVRKPPKGNQGKDIIFG
jgi:predicted house-cleaning NTP pyrophosphatase (Maf/HAM1 superfamily)